MLSGFSFTLHRFYSKCFAEQNTGQFRKRFPMAQSLLFPFPYSPTISFWFCFLEEMQKFYPLVIFNYSQHLNGNKIRKKKKLPPIFEGGHVYSFNI